MTVRELIKALQALPEDQQDLPVMVGSGCEDIPVVAKNIELRGDYGLHSVEIS